MREVSDFTLGCTLKSTWTIVMCFWFIVSFGQEIPVVEWTKTIDGPELTDYAEGVTVDADGNVYSIGTFYTEADFDPGPGEFILTTIPGSWEGFVLKLDRDGNFIWAQKLPRASNYKRSIDLDAAGNVIIGGSFYGTVDFDPGAGVFNLTSTGGNDDFYILKLTEAGNFVWAISVGNTFSDNVRDVKVDLSGNVYAVGNFRGTVDFDPGAGVFNLTAAFNNTFILKLDQNSNFLWARSIVNSPGNQANAISLDDVPNVYCAGTFSGTTDFDPGVGTFNLTSAGGTDSYITKLDANGNFIWAKSIGGGPTLRINEITQDASGSILATGIYTGTCDFDPGPGVTNYTAVVGTGDLFILKLNSTGDFVWAKVIGGSSSEEGFGIACDAAGNVYTTGSFFSGTVDFDPGPGVFNLTSAGFEDIFLSKLDPTGNMVWTIRMGGTGGGSGYADRGESLKIDAAGTIYLSGRFANGVDFDHGLCTDIRSAKAASDPFIQKIKLGTVTPPPTITSFTPAMGPIGSSVVITGTNFSSIPGNNEVTFFNNRQAIVTASTPTSITATVPASTITGRISVTVNCVTVQSATDFTVGATPVPTITSFTPASGTIGTTVTITGTNFSATPSSNIVYFGATRATVTAATATQLTVTVPVGATFKSISVMVGGLIAYSSKPFIVTFPGAALTECSFAPKQDLVAGSFPLSVESGDFDGDGKADLAVANYESNALSVFHNTSTGAGTMSFAPKIDLPSGAGANHIAIDDLDGDGKLDLAVVNHAGGDVSIFHNTSSAAGSISFAARVNFTTGSTPRSVAIDDLDKDGKSDLVIANYGEGVNTISILRNTSTGPGSVSFAPKIDFTAGTRPAAVAIEDLDGDGKPDIAVVNQNSATLSIFLNTSSGVGNISLAPKTDFSTNPNPIKVSIGDLDGDGKPDIAIAGSLGSNVNMFRNTTSGIGNVSFATRVELTAGNLPWSVSIGDINGDGKPDLAAPNVSSGNVTVFQNGSTGIGNLDFTTKFNFTSQANSQTCTITDFDGDGKPDLAATSFYGIHVLRNIIGTSPTITSFTPTSGTTGTTVTITGSNFDLTPSNNMVQFNGINATVTASTATTITTTVPTGVTTGKISVTVGCNYAESTNNFTVSTTNNQPPEIEAATSSVPIEGIVTIDLEPLISDPDDNLDPGSLYLETSVSEQGASASLNDDSFLLTLNYGNVPFFGTDEIIIGICDLEGECAEQTLTIEVGGDVSVFNALSPNGDGKNEVFLIQYIDILPATQSNKVTILNRWGDVVFEITDYNNEDRVFKGLSKNGSELPNGTYFYKIEFTGGQKTKTGFLSLRR